MPILLLIQNALSLYRSLAQCNPKAWGISRIVGSNSVFVEASMASQGKGSGKGKAPNIQDLIRAGVLHNGDVLRCMVCDRWHCQSWRVVSYCGCQHTMHAHAHRIYSWAPCLGLVSSTRAALSCHRPASASPCPQQHLSKQQYETVVDQQMHTLSQLTTDYCR